MPCVSAIIGALEAQYSLCLPDRDFAIGSGLYDIPMIQTFKINWPEAKLLRLPTTRHMPKRQVT